MSCPVAPDPIASILAAWAGGVLLGAAGRAGILEGLRRLRTWLRPSAPPRDRGPAERPCPACGYPRHAVALHPAGTTLLGACPRCADPPRTLP